MAGGSFTGLTSTVKKRLKVLFWLPPSWTVTVIVAEPFALVTGKKVNVPVLLGLA